MRVGLKHRMRLRVRREIRGVLTSLLVLIVSAIASPAYAAQQQIFDQAAIARDIERIEAQLRMLQERRTIIRQMEKLLASDKSIAILPPGSPFAPRDAVLPYVVHRESFIKMITLAVVTGEITFAQGAALAHAVGEAFKASERTLHEELVELSLRQDALERQLAELRGRIPSAPQHALPRRWNYILTWASQPAWSGGWRGGRMELDTRTPGTLGGNVEWQLGAPGLPLTGTYAYSQAPGAQNSIAINFDERTGKRLHFSGRFVRPDQISGRFYEMRLVQHATRLLDHDPVELGTWQAREAKPLQIPELAGKTRISLIPDTPGGAPLAQYACLDLTISPTGDITGRLAYIGPTGLAEWFPVTGETGHFRVGTYDATYRFNTTGLAARQWMFIGTTAPFRYGGMAPEGEYYEGAAKLGRWNTALGTPQCG